MSGFDVAAGVHQSILNDSLLPQVYTALYPTFLKGSIDINEVGISSIDYDIQGAPMVNLQPSEHAKAHIAAALEEHLAKKGVVGMSAANKSALLAAVSSATFSANISKLALTINYTDGSPSTVVPSAPMVVHATISVNGENSNLTLEIVHATITIPDNPTLTKILNNGILNYLTDYLNKNILSAITIPPLKFASLQIGAPLPVVQQSFFATFSAIGSSPVTIPKPLPWPTDGVFIAADIPTLEAAAGSVFPVGPQSNFNWEIISGHIGATVNVPKIIQIEDDGQVLVSIQANASCQLTMQTPWPIPNVSFGPSATATLTGFVNPLIEDNEFKIAIASFPAFNFSFSWGFPTILEYLFYPIQAALAAALNAILGPIINDALQNIKIHITDIPDIPIDLGADKKITISIANQATPRGLNGNLLVLTTQATVF